MKTDKLTKLLYYDDFKEAAGKVLQEEENEYVLVSLNISNFKYINDMYGYELGDKLLKHVAEFFHFKNPNSRLASRMHADRFLVMTAVNGLTEEEICGRLHKRHVDFTKAMERLYPMTMIHINAGACPMEKNAGSISELVDKAELARKSISDSYVENIAFYNERLADIKEVERRVIPVFEKAIKHDRVLVYLQPKFSIDTQEIVGAEALVRLMDTDGKIMSPNIFIPVLERAGMISDLDSYVVEKVYKLIETWINRGIEPIPISVNLSKLDFKYDAKWVKTQKTLQGSSIPKKYVEFEVTETVFFGDLEFITSKIGTIQKRGYKVSMDDFGAGYSSLNTVGVLPIDIVKFDRGFVQNSINTRKGLEIMTGLIEIFRRIGLEVICEGVETREEEQLIASCGCNLVQGYVHDCPIPIDEFERKYMHTRKKECI